MSHTNEQPGAFGKRVAAGLVLLGLTAVGVIKFLGKGPEVQATSEIQQLAVAVQAFQQNYKVPYVPSRIILRESGQYETVDLLEAESLAYLKRVWPRIQFPIDFNGDGKYDGVWFLEGDQCLVFFLGGRQALQNGAPVCQGFSSNPGKAPLGRGCREPSSR